MEPSLDIEVRSLLESKRGEWRTIAIDAGVSYSWLSKFACGRIENPGYATLRRVLMLLRAKAAKTTTTRPRSAKRLLQQEA